MYIPWKYITLTDLSHCNISEGMYTTSQITAPEIHPEEQWPAVMNYRGSLGCS